MEMMIYLQEKGKGRPPHWGVFILTRNEGSLYWKLVDIHYNESDIKCFYPNAFHYPSRDRLKPFPFNQEEFEKLLGAHHEH